MARKKLVPYTYRIQLAYFSPPSASCYLGNGETLALNLGLTLTGRRRDFN